MIMKDKIVVVTGASQGIGKCLAIKLAEKGAVIFLLARSVDKLRALEKELTEKQNRVKSIPVDLTSDEEVRDVFKQITDSHGKIDVLINNAGVGLFATVQDSNLTDSRILFDTNFFAPLLCIQQTLPLMRSNGGSIVNISSAISKHSSFYQGVYSASKSALDRLSESLRIEEGKNKIKVFSIYIDRTKTNFKNHMIGTKENYILPFKGLSATEPEVVAEKIISAIQSNKLIYHTSAKSRLFSLGSAILPSIVTKLFTEQYHKLTKSKQEVNYE
jgi:uncharacterized protein